MPGIHSALSRHYFTIDGKVRTTGGALTLAPGEFALVREDKPTAQGAQVIGTNMQGLSPNASLTLRLGTYKPKQLNNVYTHKPYSSEVFKLGDIKSIKTFHPRLEKQKFDSWILGYDGINADTAIEIPENTGSVIDIVFKGGHLDVTSGEKCHIAKFHIYREEGETMQAVIKRLYHNIVNYTIAGNFPLTDLADVRLVDSTATAPSGTDFVNWTLTVDDAGSVVDFARVQTSNPSLPVTLVGRDGITSTYALVAPDGVTPTAYSKVVAKAQIKGCENCPSGYTTLTGGYLHSVALADDGGDSKALVQGLPGAVANSAVKVGQDSGKGTYKVVLSAPLTEAQITTFLGAGAVQATAEIQNMGLIENLCTLSTTSSISWVEGDTCTAQTDKYRIQLADGECNSASRLADLQAAYPGATIAIVETEEEENLAGGCQTVYEMDVIQPASCPDCDPIFTTAMLSKQPASFEGIDWRLYDTSTPNADALMGIKITGKPFIIYPSVEDRDEFPFYETSPSITIVGGYPEEINENYGTINIELFNVKQLSFKADRDNLGYHLLPYEDEARTYFAGITRHRGNRFAQAVLGEKSVLDLGAQYIGYGITIKDTKFSQGAGHSSNIGTTYVVWSKLGQHKNVESLMQAIAAKVGIEVEQATA